MSKFHLHTDNTFFQCTNSCAASYNSHSNHTYCIHNLVTSDTAVHTSHACVLDIQSGRECVLHVESAVQVYCVVHSIGFDATTTSCGTLSSRVLQVADSAPYAGLERHSDTKDV